MAIVVPTLQSQVSIQGAPNVYQRPLQNTVGESIAEGLGNASNVFAKIQREEKLKADRTAFMEADRSTDTVANDLLNTARQTQMKDAIGITPETMAAFDKEATKISGSLKNKDQQRAYQESVNQHRSQLQRELNAHESHQTNLYYTKSREDYKDQQHVNAVTAYQDPQAIEDSIAKVASAVDQTPGLDAQQKAAEVGVRRSGIYAGVIDRYLANEDIKGAEKYYSTIKGGVNGDQATHIERGMTILRERLDARARALQDKRDAKAERMVNEYGRLIASGVPTSQEMQATMKNAVRGTPSEDEFNQLTADELQTQKILRMPIADQVKFVQDKEAALKAGGGSMRDVANYTRLRGAVEQNIKLLAESPLQFNATRTGVDVAPLDLAGVVNGDSTAQAQVTDRLNTLDGMKKQFGNVSPKVLLPQEAAQLSAVLAQSTPNQQAAVFAGLYKAMGDQAYRVAMQQIAPDSPVRALAGMLAAKQAQLTMRTHWFKPDEIAHSGDVSATILQGEDLLNASKTDKKQDGKPKLSLYLPETSTLQADFQDQIGDVFAGRPAAADIAFQAVKAYYVGRAAQTGRIAASNQDIDSRLVKEAITAALGTVVDYNGSDVLAPWGMDKSTFLDRAQKAIGDEAKRRGLKDEETKALYNASLRNAGDGTYYVTQGRNFIMDSKGLPMTIVVQ